MSNLMKYIAYTAGTLFILLGIAMIFTNIMPEYLPIQFKIMMGIVFFLYGMFRIISTIFKKQKPNEEIH